MRDGVHANPASRKSGGALGHAPFGRSARGGVTAAISAKESVSGHEGLSQTAAANGLVELLQPTVLASNLTRRLSPTGLLWLDCCSG
jgi:hypothetical protein